MQKNLGDDFLSPINFANNSFAAFGIMDPSHSGVLMFVGLERCVDAGFCAH